MKKAMILVGVTLVLIFLTGFDLTAQKKLISLDIEDTDIRTALRIVAEQSDMNIVISKNVVGSVTVTLENVTLEKALDVISKPNNYYTMENSTISVFSYLDIQQEERFAKKETKVFTLQHADVLDLRRVLLSMKTPRGKIELNPKNNQVIVIDTPAKVEEIGRAIKELDQPTEIRRYKLLYADTADVRAKLLQVIPEEKGDIFIDERTNSVIIKATPVVLRNIDELIKVWDVQHRQVLIEAKILEITLDETTKLGIDWQMYTKEAGRNPDLVDLSTKFPLGLTTGGIFKIGATLGTEEYSATLEALKNDTDTEVLSSPRIVVIDGQEANILVGSSEPYIVTTVDPDTNLLVEAVKYVDVGIKLIVTPQIGEDDYITMKIHPEVSTAKRVLDEKAVQVITTQADTTMMVKDGETMILGGLIKTKHGKTVDSIPILGSIPFLGALFRKTVDEDIKQEIAVLITPRILTEEGREAISEELEGTVERTGKIEVMIEKGLERAQSSPAEPETE